MTKYGSLGTTFADRFKPKASIEQWKETMGQGGGGTGSGERGAAMVEPGAESEARAKETAAIIAAWPRCGEDKHKYLYKFVNGREICTQGWRNEFYVHVVKGTVPHESFFDPVKRQEAGLNPAAVIKDSGPPGAGGITSHPLFIPVAIVGVGSLVVLYIRSRR